MIKKIKQFFRWVWQKITWVLRKKKYREYVVIECSKMVSLNGMHTFGEPAVQKDSVFITKDRVGYRVVKPIAIQKIDGDEFEIFSQYLHARIKRLK